MSTNILVACAQVAPNELGKINSPNKGSIISYEELFSSEIIEIPAQPSGREIQK